MRYFSKTISLVKTMFKTPVVELGSPENMRAFLQDMGMQTNPRDLYRWAREEIRAARGQPTVIEQLPGFVGWTSSKMPRQGRVETSGSTPYVRLTWTQGKKRWGLKVGPPGFVPEPIAQERDMHWEEGIYAWCLAG
ncbi:MAG: hypothetical protein GC164_03515 [Phycisphaera sp.]|nr:hypothetical protein [Phycisphaera sp.]